jgi:hypothetical protein
VRRDAACSVNDLCETGTYCAADRSCRAVSYVAGGACTNQLGCGPDLYCDGAKCVPYQGTGQACGQGFPLKTVCNLADWCSPAGICVPKLAPQADCAGTVADDYPCAFGYGCDATKKCSPPTYRGGTNCAYGNARCDDGVCIAPPGTESYSECDPDRATNCASGMCGK